MQYEKVIEEGSLTQLKYLGVQENDVIRRNSSRMYVCIHKFRTRAIA